MKFTLATAAAFAGLATAIPVGWPHEGNGPSRRDPPTAHCTAADGGKPCVIFAAGGTLIQGTCSTDKRRWSPGDMMDSASKAAIHQTFQSAGTQCLPVPVDETPAETLADGTLDTAAGGVDTATGTKKL